MMEVQLGFPFYGALILSDRYATLEKVRRERNEKAGPPWADNDFSYRFGGLPPVEMYVKWGYML